MSERKDIDAIVGATVKLEESLNKRISELEKIVQDRKEYDLYLAKGGLIEQMIIRYAELKEKHGELDESYCSSMELIKTSLENLLRRVRKLEGKDSGGEE